MKSQNTQAPPNRGWRGTLLGLAAVVGLLPGPSTLISGHAAEVSGSIERRVFDFSGGVSIQGLLLSQGLSRPPVSVSTLSSFEAPVNAADNYSQVIMGYITPTNTSAYTFWLASDDQGALFLSTDSNPSNIQIIAREPEWNPSRDWTTTIRRPANENRSSPINLIAGQKYFVAAVMSEATGGDHLGVTWRASGEAPPEAGTPGIPGTFLSHDTSLKVPLAEMRTLLNIQVVPDDVTNAFYIEAEDFNYDSGKFKTEANSPDYRGGAYNGLGAVHNVDYFRPDNVTDAASLNYRAGETPNVPMNAGEAAHGGLTLTMPFKIGWHEGGGWYNYTRALPAGKYNVQMGISSAATVPMNGEISIGDGPQTTAQQEGLVPLGVFSAPPTGGWGVNANVTVTMADGPDAGTPAVITIPEGGAQKTFRVTLGRNAGDFDYFRLVPVSEEIQKAKISGKVTTLTGTPAERVPLANASVTLVPGGRSATTAADGTYSIAGLGAGNYGITFAREGYSNLVQTVNLATATSEAAADATLSRIVTPGVDGKQSFDGALDPLVQLRRDAALIADGGNPGGYIQLTTNVAFQCGQVEIPIGNVDATTGLTLATSIKMGGGNVGRPADGMAFSFGAITADCMGENGSGSGLVLRFNTYDNGDDPEGLQIVANNVLKHFIAMPVRDGNIADPKSPQTGPVNNPGWAPFRILWRADQTVDVYFKGVKITPAGGVDVGLSPTAGTVTVSARTGGANEIHAIDEFCVLPGAVEPVLASNLRVTVGGPDAAPINEPVNLQLISAIPGTALQATTINGESVFSNLVFGVYTIIASHPDFLSLTNQFDSKDYAGVPLNLRLTKKPVDVEPGTITCPVVIDFKNDPATDPGTPYQSYSATGGGTWRPQHGADGADDGYLMLTDAVNTQNSKVVFDSTSGGRPPSRIRVEADLRIGGSTTGRPADGFSISYVRDNDPLLSEGSAGFVDGFPEAGSSTGVSVGFDSWSGNVIRGEADVEGIIIRADDKTIARYPLPLRNPENTDTNAVDSLQTGPVNPATVDGATNPPDASWSLLKWEHVEFDLTADGKLRLAWKGIERTPPGGLPTGLTPFSGRIVMGARTGAANQAHHLDNLKITTYVVGASNLPPEVALTSPTPNQVVPPGSSLELSATAIDDCGVASVEYLDGTTVIATATRAPFMATWTNVPAGTRQITARVTDKTGLLGTSAPVTINPVVIVSQPPVITAQPQSLTAPEDGNTQFTVSAAGGLPLSYQWRRNGSPLSDDARITGTRSATLALRNLQRADEAGYDCVISNADGSTNSAVARLTILVGEAPAELTSVIAKTTARRGATVSIPVTVRNFISIANFTYTLNWDPAVLAFAGADSFRLPGLTPAAFVAGGTPGRLQITWPGTPGGISSAVDNTVIYALRFVVLDTATTGSPITASASSATFINGLSVSVPSVFIAGEVSLEVGPPSITGQPMNQTASPGGGFTLSVVANSQGSTSYQWKRDGVEIPGAHGASLNIPAASADDVGRYTVTVKNSAGEVTSQAATVALTSLDLYPGLLIQGPVGAKYRVEYATQLGAGAKWTALGMVTLDSPEVLYVDRTPARTAGRYYQAVLVP